MNEKIGLVCCSNAQTLEDKPQLDMLERKLADMGIDAVYSPYIYADDSVFPAETMTRACALMDFYRDDAVREIFDISGGDIANGILPLLDYDLIAESGKSFWGYSDLTTVINAVYTMTGNINVLYQIRNIVGKGETQADEAAGDEAGPAEIQAEEFAGSWRDFCDRRLTDGPLFRFSYDFLQGSSMSGIVVGGNIRCLLKLAGTPYFPDMREKILFLEARSGYVPQMSAYLSQLAQMEVLDKISGILLGTFSEAERRGVDIGAMVSGCVRDGLPVAKTGQIGHGADSKAIAIGGMYQL